MTDDTFLFPPPPPPNVTKLPVWFKAEPGSGDRTLEVVYTSGCTHLFTTYKVAESEAEVTCGKCGAKLNPIWVLVRLAHEDRRYLEAQQRYQEEMKRIEERERTKCEHCAKMTRISRR